MAANVFGLSHAVLQCSESTTLEDFSSGILVAGKSPAEERRARLGSEAEKVLESSTMFHILRLNLSYYCSYFHSMILSIQ